VGKVIRYQIAIVISSGGGGVADFNTVSAMVLRFSYLANQIADIFRANDKNRYSWGLQNNLWKIST